MMLDVSAAHDCLHEFLHEPHASHSSDAWPPAPVVHAVHIDHANSFLALLLATRKSKRLSIKIKGLAGNFLSQVREVTTGFGRHPVVQLAVAIVQRMADHVEMLTRSGISFNWSSVGFKDLSHLGYDVPRGGLGTLDYGNATYTELVAYFCLVDDDFQSAIRRLSAVWPSLMVWAPAKSDHRLERIGDIFEILMAGFRGDGPFNDLVQRFAPQPGILPMMFQALLNLCKLVHFVDGVLVTGSIKHKHHEFVHKLTAGMEFTAHPWTQGWLSSRECGVDAGMFLFALLSTASLHQT